MLAYLSLTILGTKMKVMVIRAIACSFKFRFVLDGTIIIATGAGMVGIIFVGVPCARHGIVIIAIMIAMIVIVIVRIRQPFPCIFPALAGMVWGTFRLQALSQTRTRYGSPVWVTGAELGP